jgi:uncharacterized protein
MAAAAFTATAGAYPFLVEPHWLELTHTTVSCVRAPKQPIRILHLSDLHASSFVPISIIDNAISLGLAQKPDVICLTGDFITFKHDFDEDRYIHSLRRLSQAAPTFAVVGNHDGSRWAPAYGGHPNHDFVDGMLARSGIELLHNRSERLTVRGSKLSLAGTGDLWGGEIDASAAFRTIETADPVVLLAHNPDSKKLVAPFPWHLMLSGHTHGGQVLIPFKGPYYVPIEDKRFTAGLCPWGNRSIYVTRGVGNLAGVRFLCRPEVTVLDLRCAA